ncbi:ABC transporter permease [Brooklawnia cerclae]|uniref:Peptide/nickel transport system permease protein n=1 Tax=Brooklawnia cerclae TaxID=349934 RepID=A0ABX0SMR3_9ACTN|nr:ABC transporter permease [Brooklawnia cerclae]NIH58056.1 peptide/nickel transport system permease protein [Brooklawnia cerclae]
MVLTIAKRLAAGVGLLFVVATLIFIALHLVPGDPARTILTGTGAVPTDAAVENLREQLGLNLPLGQQYLRYLHELVTGSLGTSLNDNRPVIELIGERLPRTLQLIGSTTVVSVIVGVTIGALAARRGGLIDRIVMVLTSFAVAVPAYVAAVLLVYFVGVKLQWLPSGGYVDPAVDVGRHLRALVLPTISLSLGFSGIVARMTRSAVLNVGNQDWVRTALSVGLTRGQVFRRHVLRNSLSPVVTVTSLQMGGLLGGTVIIERVFSWPGLSGLLIDGVTSRNYPVVQGIVILIAALFILLNIVVDIVYGLLDPRGRSK